MTELQATRSELAVLRDTLGRIDTDLLALKSPFDTLDEALGDVEDALKQPGKIKKDVDAVQSTLAVMQQLASDVDWMPEIGTAAGAVTRGLRPLSGPPGRGALGTASDALHRIDDALKPVASKVDKVRKPVHTLDGKLTTFEARLTLIMGAVDTLLRTHGGQPPAEVENCAGKLNHLLLPVVDGIDDAKERVLAELHPVTDTLQGIAGAFHTAEGYVRTIEGVLSHLQSRAYRDALAELRKLEKAAHDVGKWIFEHTIKKLFPDIAKLRAFLRQLEGRIEAFAQQKVSDLMTSLEQRLEREIERVPGVEQLEARAAALEKTVEDTAGQLEKFLAGECAHVLGLAEPKGGS
jgi:hypothetical protein